MSDLEPLHNDLDTTAATSLVPSSAETNRNESTPPPPPQSSDMSLVDEKMNSPETSEKNSNYAPKHPSKLGRKGDPRMHTAVAVRMQNPSISLLEALRIGGFLDYPPDADSNHVDSENIPLSQRKNQLNRRLRMAKKEQKDSLVMTSHMNPFATSFSPVADFASLGVSLVHPVSSPQHQISATAATAGTPRKLPKCSPFTQVPVCAYIDALVKIVTQQEIPSFSPGETWWMLTEPQDIMMMTSFEPTKEGPIGYAPDAGRPIHFWEQLGLQNKDEWIKFMATEEPGEPFLRGGLRKMDMHDATFVTVLTSKSKNSCPTVDKLVYQKKDWMDYTKCKEMIKALVMTEFGLAQKSGTKAPAPPFSLAAAPATKKIKVENDNDTPFDYTLPVHDALVPSDKSMEYRTLTKFGIPQSLDEEDQRVRNCVLHELLKFNADHGIVSAVSSAVLPAEPPKATRGRPRKSL